MITNKISMIWLFLIWLIPNISHTQKAALVVQNGHQYGGSSSIATSNDGVYIATGGGMFDSNIKIWHVPSGKEIKTFKGHKGLISDLIFSKKNQFLISSSWDKTVKVWDFPSGKLLQTISHNFDNINAIALHNSEKMLAIGTGGTDNINDNAVYIWDLEQKKCLKALKFKELVMSLDFHNDLLVSASGIDKRIEITLWDIKSNKKVFKKSKAHKGIINKVFFIEDGKYIVSAGADKMIKVWSCSNKKVLNKFEGHPFPITDMVYVPKDSSLFCVSGGKYWGDNPGGISQWKLSLDKNKRNHLKEQQLTKKAISGIIYPIGSRYMYCIDEFGISEWDIQRNTEVRQFGYNLIYSNEIYFAMDNKLIDFSDYKITLINNQLGTTYQFKTDSIIDISVNGNILAAASDKIIYWWNLKDTTLHGKIKLNNFIQLVEISPNGDYIVSITENKETLDTYLNAYELKQNTIIQHIDFLAKDILVTEFDKIKFLEDNWTIGLLHGEEFIEIDIKEGSIDLFEDNSTYPMLDFIYLNDKNEILTVGGMDPLLYNRECLLWDRTKRKIKKTYLDIHQNIISSISLNKDIIATGSYDGIVKLWKLPEFECIDSLSIGSFILDIEFNQNGKYLAIASLGHPIKLWDRRNTNHLNIINYAQKGDYIFYLTNGFYKSTKNRINSIGFEYQNKGFGFEQFDLKYNRPDKILSQMNTTSSPLLLAFYKAYQKRLKKLNFTEGMLSNDFHVPEIRIATKNIPSITEQQNLNIQIKATDTQQNLDRLNIWINDIPIHGINGINLRPKNTKTWEQDLKLTLSQGENKVQVSALNQGGAESLKETFYITYDVPKKKPSLYIVGIGANDFPNNNLDLKYPKKDIQDLVNLYQSQSNKYEKVVIETLYNSEVSKENLQKIKTTLNQSKVDDQVILFVAGHGLLDDSLDYYFATPNTDFNKPSVGGILYEDLENLLDGIPARQKLFLMDACHSGEIDKEETELVEQKMVKNKDIIFRSFGKTPQQKNLGLENSFELMKQLFVDLRRGTGATVISSASGVEFAWEGEKWNNSVFTYTLLSGLKEQKADLNQDGRIMVSELQEYLSTEVSRLTNNHQRPTMRLENISNDWQVW